MAYHIYYASCLSYSKRGYIKWPHGSYVKVKVVVLESRLHDNACSTDFTFPLARWAPMQPATVDPTLDLCTRYPLRVGGPRQCWIQSLPDTSTCGQHWESNPRPSDLESNALSTRPHDPTRDFVTCCKWNVCLLMGQRCISVSEENCAGFRLFRLLKSVTFVLVFYHFCRVLDDICILIF